MSTAGFPPKRKASWMDSTENVPDWKDPIHSFSGVFLGFNSFMHIYILYLFIQSAPFGTSKNPFSRSALKAQISERIAFLALADADHLQQSFSSAGAGIQGRQSNWEAAFRNEFLVKIGLHHVTSILVCSHTAPYYIPGILCWEILWVLYVIHPEPGHVSRQVNNWRSSLQPLEVFPLSLKQYTSNTLFNTPTRDLTVALTGICVEVYDVYRMSIYRPGPKNGSSMVKTKNIERIEHPTMVFPVAVFTP